MNKQSCIKVCNNDTRKLKCFNEEMPENNALSPLQEGNNLAILLIAMQRKLQHNKTLNKQFSKRYSTIQHRTIFIHFHILKI